MISNSTISIIYKRDAKILQIVERTEAVPGFLYRAWILVVL